MLTACGLLAVGMAALSPPPLPVRVSATGGSGNAIGYSRHGAGYRMSDRLLFKWDLDQSCIGAVKFETKGINEWTEFVSCGGRYTEYSSATETCWSRDVPLSQRSQPLDRLEGAYAGFTRHISDRLRDPIWSQSFMRVFKNEQLNAYIYVSLSDNVVRFVQLQDYFPGGEDYIIHFPNGLVEQTSSVNFTFEKAPCNHSTSDAPSTPFSLHKQTQPSNEQAQQLFE